MRAISLLILSLAISSCGKMNTLNGVSSDQQRFSDLGSTQFIMAKAVMTNQCATCHYHSAFANYSEEEWASSGLIMPGSAATSTLFKRLKNNGISGSAQDMPPTGELSVEEIQSISDWINSIGNNS